jgi:hypothetical protein
VSAAADGLIPVGGAQEMAPKVDARRQTSRHIDREPVRIKLPFESDLHDSISNKGCLRYTLHFNRFLTFRPETKTTMSRDGSTNAVLLCAQRL